MDDDAPQPTSPAPVQVGRPTKRTPELTARLADAMARGLSDQEAAALVGIDDDTLTEWNKIAEFSGAVKRARARRNLERLERIERGEQGWQGTAWAMERLYPDRFARPATLVQNNVMAAAVANSSAHAISPDRLELIQELRRRALRDPASGSP